MNLLKHTESFLVSSLLNLSNTLERVQLSHATSQCRWFGGRLGGTKRQKVVSRGRIVQTGWGKRIEFQRSKKNAEPRTRLYQNSRANLVFDDSAKQYLVTWYRDGQQFFHPFSPGRLPLEQARRNAIVFIETMDHLMHGPPAPSVSMSGVRGVFYDAEEAYWVAKWNQGGSKRYRGFPVRELGFDKAYKGAVEMRRQKTANTYHFTPQRFRFRSGTGYLK